MAKNKVFYPFLLFFLLLLSIDEGYAQCTASISSSVNPPKGCSPFTIQLTDASTGIVTNRVWSFGDGSPNSSVQNPIHTFTKSSGNDTVYVVTLKTYCLGGDSSIATMSVTVYSPPQVSFTANNVSICAIADTVCFTNTSETGAGYLYNWNFGDNTSSNQFSPCKIYTNDSTFSVILTVTDSNGCQASLTKTGYITVKKAPNPDFTISPQIGCGPLVVTFNNTTNTTVDTIASWLWNFGDGGGSSQQNPGVHTYTLAPDTPIVTLLATNNLGCTNYTTKVIVVKPTPVAAFSIPAKVCPNDSATAVFTGTTDPSSTYVWSFDGATVNSGTGQGPYSLTWATSGLKNISLIVNDNGCSDTLVQSIIVNPEPLVSLSSSAVNDSICDGTPVVFTASPGNYINYIFYLNSSIVQNSASNTYSNSTINNNDTIRVSATDINGCESQLSSSIIIRVKPVPTVTLSLLSASPICEGDSSHFSVLPASLNGGYVFYDGFSPEQSGLSNVFNYLKAQTHTVTVIGTLDGCPSLPSNSVVVTVVKKLTPTTVNCSTSTDSTISFTWDPVPTATAFEVSIDGGPFITPSSGSLGLTHTVTGLNVNDSATIIVRFFGPTPCNDTIVSAAVKCYARNCTGITFNLVGPSTACSGDTITASAININPGTYNISWNGGTAGVTNNFYVYGATNDTNIVAVVTNTLQPTCPAVTRTLTIPVNPLPTVTLTASDLNDSICAGQVITFTASPTSYSNYTFYNGLGVVQNGASPYYSGSLTSGSVIKVVATDQSCSGTASNAVSYTIIPPLNFPQVNCGTSTDTTIVFTWGAVTGSLGYEVSINGGAYTIPSSGSTGLTHVLTGLTPGAFATIEVKALGPPPCGNSVISFAQTCYAKPCSSITFNYSNAVNVCDGDSVTLQISNINISSYNISWNGGPLTSNTTYSFLPVSSGVVSVSVINTGQTGCPSAIHYTNVTVIPLPVVTLSSSALNDSSCSGTPLTFTANPQTYGNYSFYDNFALVQNSSNPVYTTSSFINGHVIKVIVSNNGCADTSLNTLSPTIIMPLATPQVNCGTTTDTTITFTWDTIAGAIGYQVSVGGGQYVVPSSGATGTSHTINGFSPGDSITITVMALGTTPCGNSAASAGRTCYAMPCTGISFSLIIADTICEGSGITLTAGSITPATYNISWNGGAFGTQTTYSLSPAITTTVNAVVSNTAQPTCPNSFKYTIITVIPTPTVTLSFSSGNDSICTGSSIQVIASPATYDNYAFYNNTLSVQSSGNPTYSSSTLTGVNTFSVITDNMGCIDTSSSITLTVIPPLPLTYSSNASNDTICQGAIYSLTTSPAGLSRYVYAVNGNVAQDSSLNIFNISSMPPGSNIITVTGYNYLGCTNSPVDSITVVVLPYTNVTLTANAFDSICNHQQVIFTASPSGLSSYSFYRNSSLVQSTSSNTYTTNTLTANDTITVRSTNLLGCLSAASAGITFTIKPTADINVVGGDTILFCSTFGSPLTLSAINGSTLTPVTYFWSTGQQGTNISVNPTTTTLYNVYGVYKGCPGLRDTTTVIVDNLPLPTASATPLITEICLGDSVLLQGTGSAQRYEWRTNSGSVITTSVNVFVKPLADSIYTFRAYNTACYDDATVTVEVDKCLSDLSGPIPQIITPNGDGANDTWIIPDIDYFTENKVSIYNRWGQLVYEKSPYLNEWSGQELKSGKDLPDGSYYYVITLGEKYDKKHVGFVIIHR